MNEPEPVACSLASEDISARMDRWARLRERALVEQAPIPAGVRLRFQRVDAVERELAELVALERECCAFATWTLHRAGTSVRLEITAAGDGVAAVRALFDEPAAAGDTN